MSKQIHILALESSCDDTGAAVLRNREVLSNLIANQKVHESYGGVVPELASREHQKNIIPSVQQALTLAGVSVNDIDAIAFTQGPGLMGSLLVANNFAKGLSMALNKPLIAVNHMQAHILAHFLSDTLPVFPFLCLTVSGGHTQLVLVKSHFDYQIIGETLDDAAGEAFDKTGKLLGLPYPAGPHIDRLAKQGNPKAFGFSRAEVKDYNYSFSGLKTSVLYFLQEQTKKDPHFIQLHVNDLCASIQYTIVEMLVKTLEKAAQNIGVNEIAIAGGVSANSALRKALQVLCDKRKWRLHIPSFEYCTDNAAMIGVAAYFKFLEGDFAELKTPSMARMSVTEN
jgi:N6-L-threonylcarbamoyladenine synthase